MNPSDTFNFTDAPLLRDNEFVATIPAGLKSADALLHALYERVHLPGYFGFNWDALSDCLRDLHWIENDRVVLLHADLPALPLTELRAYLDVLAECVTSWTAGEAHSLVVVFPLAARSQVAGIDLSSK